MSVGKHTGNHHENTRASFSETGECRRARRNSDGRRVTDPEPRGSGVTRVQRQEMGIRGIAVLRAVQVQSAGPLVTEAEFPRAGKFTLDGEIRLMRVAVDEVSSQGKGERQN